MYGLMGESDKQAFLSPFCHASSGTALWECAPLCQVLRFLLGFKKMPEPSVSSSLCLACVVGRRAVWMDDWHLWKGGIVKTKCWEEPPWGRAPEKTTDCIQWARGVCQNEQHSWKDNDSLILWSPWVCKAVSSACCCVISKGRGGRESTG